MNTRCLFRCEKAEVPAGFDCMQVILRASYEDNIEHLSFSKYTPTGVLDFCVTNEAVIPMFKVGKYYYIDICEKEE